MPRELRVGTRIGDYEIKRVLGQGGFGITYLAHDENLARDVAIKEYFPREFAHREAGCTVVPSQDEQERADFDWGMRHFVEEARSLTRFRHKNIVGAIGFIRNNGTAYLVMEYCDGESLEALAKRVGPLPAHVLIPIVNQLLDGLDEVHRVRLLQLDVKPSNIFIKQDGTVVLLDFGSVRQAISSHTKSVMVGSPGYAAPEQGSDDVDARARGPWTDIYGLGATLYRLMSGSRPQEAMARLIQDKLVGLSVNSELGYSAGLVEAVNSALRLKAPERPQSIADFRRYLARPAPVEPSTKPSTPEPTGKSPALHDEFSFGKLVAVVVIASVPLGLWLINSSTPNSDEAPSDPAPTEIPNPDSPGPTQVQGPSECPTDRGEVWSNCIGSYTYDNPVESPNGKIKRYEGLWNNNAPATRGKITFADGRVYEGDHDNLNLDGQGELTTPDGTKYIGNFKKNAQTGQGTKTWRDGKVAGGQFVGGALRRGSLRESDGTTYIGRFLNNKLNGSGAKVTRSNGYELRYVGDWKDGDMKVGILYADCVVTQRGIFENGVFLSSMELKESDYPCK